MPGSMTWRLALVFGLLTTAAVILASVSVYVQSARDFGRETEIALHALAGTVAQSIDTDRLDRLASFRDPFYEELRGRLHRITVDYNLSWLGVYRFRGDRCLHIADGEDLGNGFCLDYPIMSVPDELRRAWEGNPTDSGTYEDAYGSWQSSFCPVRRRDGTVAAVIDASRNLAMLQRFRGQVIRRTALLVAAIAGLTLALCLLIARSVSGPVVELSQAAGRIASGQLSTRIPTMQSTAEIEALIVSFNRMAGTLEQSQQQLERRLFELTLLHEISRQVTFGATAAGIQRLILEKAMEALQASGGHLLLWTEESRTLTMVCSLPENSAAAAHEPVRVQPDDCLAGRAFLDWQPLHAAAGPDGLLRPFGPDDTLTARNLLTVPLLIEGKPIGILCLTDRTPGDFGPADTVLATTLASQIAVTIEKARLYEQAVTDGLTRLYVHRYFQLALDNELKRARRHEGAVSLILLDIDHFKSFNDTWGHQVGDQVLAATATILRQSLRGPDVPARYGGEEFAVILPETGPQDALIVAERIRRAVEGHQLTSQGQALKVTISLGLASFPAHSGDKLDLIKKADSALYISKKNGRNRTTVFEAADGTATAG